jgi:prepilin-type processing-associated H-X9-DG protein
VASFNEDPPNQLVREASVKVYTCPSDVNADRLLKPESGPGSGNLYRTGSYRAMSGRSDGTGWFDTSEAAALPKSWRGALHTTGYAPLGLFPERLDGITDGTSNTLLVGERATRTYLGRSTFWAYSYAYNQSSAYPVGVALNGDFDACAAAVTTLPGGVNICRRGWGSFHPGVLNFVMCDGSVRPISPNIDLTLWVNLATIAGGEPTGAF